MNLKSLLVIASVLCFTISSAVASDLVRMDLQKNSGNGIDVTLYTTEIVGNSMVSKKSDNKYVILMPNVAGKSAVTPDLGSVKDLVADVNIKNVQDGLNGYTKITLITTKPLNIKTNVKKTAPLSKEEHAAKAVIAQSKTIQPKAVATEVKPKTENKTSTPIKQSNEVKKPASENKITTKPTNEIKKPVTVVSKPAKEILKQKNENKPAISTVASKSDVKPQVQNNSVKTEASATNSLPAQKISDNKTENKNIENINAKEEIKVEAPINFETSKIEKIAKDYKKPINKLPFAIIIMTIVGFCFIIKFLKNSIQKSMILKQSFNENLKEKKVEEKVKDYSNIINDKNKNWQEKYNEFVNDSSNTEETKTVNEIKETKEQIQKPLPVKPKKLNVIKTDKVSIKNNPPIKEVKEEVIPEHKENNDSQDIKISNTDVKRLEFERSYTKTPTLYEQQIIKENEVINEVTTEDEKIAKELHTIKLKTFAKPPTLHTTNRNRLNREITINPGIHETKYEEIEESAITSTSRQFEDAALNVTELMDKGSKYMKNHSTNSIKANNKGQNYIMSTIDEYFALLDKEPSEPQSMDLSQRIAKSLLQLKPSMYVKQNEVKETNKFSNPFSRTSNNDHMESLVIKRSCNIDEHKSFHIVSLNGVNSLIGRVDSEIIVIKNFDKEVSNLQIRHDNENVYMVKADDFKALVDVNNDKMGVLIEL